jgi:hypothetical protein
MIIIIMLGIIVVTVVDVVFIAVRKGCSRFGNDQER